LHSRTLGHGPAPVLALHCGLGQGGMWKAVASHLPEATLTAPDLLGHGRSAPFPKGEDVHDSATRALAPFVHSPTHLVGHSFGAVIALTLIEPVFFAAAPEGPIKSAHRQAEETLFETFATEGEMAAARAFQRLWGGGVPWDSFKPAMQTAMATQMDFVVRSEPSLWQDSAGMLAPEALERLTCPVRLLRGSATVPIIQEVHKGLLTRLPQARETIVEGAAHMMVVSHPAEVAAALSRQLLA